MSSYNHIKTQKFVILLKKSLIINMWKLNVNTDTMIKNEKPVELHTKYATIILNTHTLEMI